MKEPTESGLRWERAKAMSGWVVAIILGFSLVGVVAVATNPSFSTILQPGSLVQSCSYLIFVDAGNYFARNCETGSIATTGTVWETVVQYTIGQMSSGGRILFAPGTYVANPQDSSEYAAQHYFSVVVSKSNIQISGSQGTFINMKSNAGGGASSVALVVFLLGKTNAQVSNITIDGFNFFGNPDGQPGGSGTQYESFVWIYSAKNVWIRNNFLYMSRWPIYADNGGGGSLNGNNIHIDDNTISNQVDAPGQGTTNANRFHGIALHNIGADSEVSGNLIIYPRIGILLDGNGPTGNPSVNAIVTGNVIVYPESPPAVAGTVGIYFYDSVYDTIVSNNIIRGRPTYGIDMLFPGGDSDGPSSHNLIQGNMIDNAGTTIRYQGDYNAIQYNDFRHSFNQSYAAVVIDAGSNFTILRYNLGWATERSGSVTLASNTTYTFNHNLVATPVLVTLSANVTACGALGWTATSSQITVTATSSCTATIYWYAQTWNI